MRVLDLFSGIGGFSLGLERAGMRTVQFCEIDPFCRRVLAKHWPGVPCHEDVRTLPRIGGVDLVCGGYPCQPFSHAGDRKGPQDDRHLWPEMRRVVAQERPTWVLAENVTGHISLGLDQVLADLEADGYACRAIAVPAAAVGAWHIRGRVWIVGRNANGNGEPALPFDDEASGLQSASPNTDGEGLQERQGEAVGRGTVREAREAAPSSGWWDIEPDVGRVANGVPNRVDRIRALGNAVVPQVVEVIGRAIMRASK